MREVEARLKLSAVDRTAKAFDAVQRRLKAVEKQTSAVNRTQKALDRSAGGALLAVGRLAAPGLIAAGVGRSIKNFAAFERQMTRIGTTSGATAEEVKKAAGSLHDLALSTALPIDEVVSGLDTLTASGMSLKDAMAFLPSVLQAAQASGAATEDIANTALKASSALKIEAGGLSNAFDIMVAGGKAGQFELKDMAQYIPGLANSFATLGYEGEDGLKKLVALMQTVREDTGDASTAATDLSNIFGKIYSGDTANAFKKMGVDLPAALERAKAAGEDTVTAFLRITKEVINGDLTKLPLLFADAQYREGIQSLLTSEEALRGFLAVLNGAEVKGTVFRDLNTVLGDTQSKLQNFATSWDRLVEAVGATAAPVAVPLMENISKGLTNAPKADEIRKATGVPGWKRALEYGSTKDADLITEYDSYDKMSAPGSAEAVRLQAMRNYSNRGRLDQAPVTSRGFAVPSPRDLPYVPAAPVVQAPAPARAASVPSGREALSGIVGRLGPDPSRFGGGETVVQGVDELRQAMESGSQSVASAGETAGSSIQAGGDAAAANLLAAIQQGAATLSAAIASALSAGVKVSVSGGTLANRAPATTMPNAGQAGG